MCLSERQRWNFDASSWRKNVTRSIWRPAHLVRALMPRPPAPPSQFSPALLKYVFINHICISGKIFHVNMEAIWCTLLLSADTLLRSICYNLFQSSTNTEPVESGDEIKNPGKLGELDSGHWEEIPKPRSRGNLLNVMVIIEHGQFWSRGWLSYHMLNNMLMR